jgi:hypothetical protein
MTTTEERVDLSGAEFAGKLRGFMEKARVATQVHLAHLKLNGRTDALAEAVLPQLEAVEDTVENQIRELLRGSKVWTTWAGPHVGADGEIYKVKGAGPMVLGAVMSRADITRLTSTGKMWAHFGFAPGQRLKAGEKLDYDATGKTWCYRLGTQLMLAGGLFKLQYDQEMERLTKRFEGEGRRIIPAKAGTKVPDDAITALHVSNMARRKMIKTFLACLYKVWREAEGLTVRPSYAVEHGHTTHEYDPWAFVERVGG